MAKALVVIFIIIIASNIFSRPDCRYSNFSGSFTFQEINFNDRNFRMCKDKFEVFKAKNKVDTVLYRLCAKNYFKFWNYNSYFFSEKFKLPFLPWADVKE